MGQPSHVLFRCRLAGPFFNDCKVPVENMLSERQNGFKIAVNILNIGRIKLGAGVRVLS